MYALFIFSPFTLVAASRYTPTDDRFPPAVPTFISGTVRLPLPLYVTALPVPPSS